jgi:hypothetical protein
VFLWQNSINSIENDRDRIMSIYELLLKDNCIDLLEGGEQYLYRLMIL